MSLTLSVNGTQHTIDVEPDTPLLWVLGDTLGLTGTKYGCGVAQCGACTVHLDGQAVPLLPHGGVRRWRARRHHHRGRVGPRAERRL